MFVQYCYERTKVQFNCEINITSYFMNKKFFNDNNQSIYRKTTLSASK